MPAFCTIVSVYIKYQQTLLTEPEQMTTTPMTDAQAAEAIRAHHAELETNLRRQVAALTEAVQARQPHANAQHATLDFLERELLPHAAAEEQALYPAGDTGPTALLVRGMRDEHANLIGHVRALRDASDAVESVARSSAILALFESHLHKENDLLIPALVDDPTVTLAELLGGMHELLGSGA
jgi:iron-sulfur cluster repair protein YtfE (RIC family)